MLSSLFIFVLQTLRDPRFDDLSGEYKAEIFEKTYKFINDIKHREKEVRFSAFCHIWAAAAELENTPLHVCLRADRPEEAEEDEQQRPEEGEAAVPAEEDGESELLEFVSSKLKPNVTHSLVTRSGTSGLNVRTFCRRTRSERGRAASSRERESCSSRGSRENEPIRASDRSSSRNVRRRFHWMSVFYLQTEDDIFMIYWHFTDLMIHRLIKEKKTLIKSENIY